MGFSARPGANRNRNRHEARKNREAFMTILLSILLSLINNSEKSFVLSEDDLVALLFLLRAFEPESGGIIFRCHT
jgi:hypothetical protein